MRIWRPLLLLPSLLTGCAGPAERQTPRFLHQVHAGTVLALERELPFKAGEIRVYFQDGQLHHRFGFFGRGGVNRYRAHCMLELKQAPDAAMNLSPRDFQLRSVRWDVTYLMMDTSEFRTQWRLADGGEPSVHAFTCIKTGNAAYEPHLTLEEIDRVVGNYFRLKEAAN